MLSTALKVNFINFRVNPDGWSLRVPITKINNISEAITEPTYKIVTHDK